MLGDSLMVQWLGLGAGEEVQSLIRKLRSYKL